MHAYRRLRSIAIVLAVSVALLELVSFAALRLLGIGPDRSYREMYQTSGCLKANDFNYGRYARSTDDLEVMLNTLPHPYFGFTVNPQRTDPQWRDKMVGPNYENELRYRIMLGEDSRPADTFTIGVLGASVAGDFVAHILDDASFANRLRSEIPALRSKKIVIRDMTIGSSRQPAQLAIATQYMELLDMTLNLDGFSEVSVIQHPRYPVEFPMFSDVFYSGAGPSTYLRLRTGEEICRRISRLPALVPPLARSNFYYFLWHSVSKRINASLYLPSLVNEERVADPFTPEQMRKVYAEYFRKYTRTQHQTLSANGVRAYFFLQPNQWVDGSKPFSPDERALFTNYPAGQEIGARYALLRAKVRELHEHGVPAFDLTTVYSDVPQTIYVDACCHVNELGNQLIADRIADIIVREETRRR